MLLVMLSLTLAQAPPAFDVASVKPAAPILGDSYNINLGRTDHGELTMSNVNLAECLKFAYGFTDNIQLGGPEWIFRKGDNLFDIVAKAPPDTPREQLKLMLRTLLAERFQLVTHAEQRQAAFLALTESKKGIKLVETDPTIPGSITNTFHLGHIDSKGVYLSALATVLSRFMRQPVLDMTGLPGRYIIKLDWSPDPVDPEKAASASPGPSIYTALQEQLGLRLESRKGPIEVLAVDSALRVPISN